MKYKKLLHLIFPLLIFLFVPDYSVQFIALVFILVFSFSFCYSLLSLVNIRAIRANSIQRTYKHETLEIAITIINRGLLPLHQVFLCDNHGGLETDGGEKIQIPLLRLRTKTDLCYRVKGTNRGEYLLGPLIIKGADPLGFFPWRKSFTETERVIVYPQVFAVNIKDKKGLPGGSIKVDNPVYEDITNYKSIREYIPGDDLRRINWKVSARLGSLYTMQYLPSMHYSAVILLNLRLDDYPVKYRYRTLESAIETAASLVYHCINRKQEASLICAGIIGQQQNLIAFPLRKDEGHAVQILETLARIAPDNQGPDVFDVILKPGIKIPWGSRIMYVGPQCSEKQLYTLHILKDRGFSPELFFATTGKKHDNYGIPVYYSGDICINGMYHV